MTEQAKSQRRLVPSERVIQISLLFFYLSLVVIKCQAFLVHGRFWAEEANIFFVAEHGGSVFHALRFVSPTHGQYFLGLDLFVFLATRVPFAYAPLVTTYLALLTQAFVAAMIIFFKNQLKLRTVYVAVLLILMVTMPQADELLATATNLHWYFQILMVLILVLPAERRTTQVFLAGLLFVSGFTSFSIVFLLPLFLVKAAVTHKRYSWVLVGTAVIPSLLQIVIFFASATHRVLDLNPLENTLAAIFQQWISPALGWKATDALAEVYKPSLMSFQLDSLPLFVITIAAAVGVYYYVLRKGDQTIRLIVVGALVLLIGNSLGATDSALTRISAWQGGRYHFAPSVLFFLALAMIPGKHVLVKAYLALVVVSGLLLGMTYRFTGVDWRQALAKADALHLAEVETWPLSDYWKIPNYDVHDGYTLTTAQYATLDQAFAACQQDCLFALTTTQASVDQAFLQSLTQYSGSAPLQETGTARALITDAGKIVAENSDPQTSVHYSAGIFDITIDGTMQTVTVNTTPLDIAPGTTKILLIDNANRVIAVQSFP